MDKKRIILKTLPLACGILLTLAAFGAALISFAAYAPWVLLALTVIGLIVLIVWVAYGEFCYWEYYYKTNRLS